MLFWTCVYLNHMESQVAQFKYLLNPVLLPFLCVVKATKGEDTLKSFVFVSFPYIFLIVKCFQADTQCGCE